MSRKTKLSDRMMECRSVGPRPNCAHTRLEDPARLKLNPRNPNKHPAEQLKIYAKILTHQGFRKAIVVSNQSGLVVTGEGAVLTARANGWSSVPVDYQDFPSPADEYAHMLADNRLPQMAEMDEAMLAEILSQDIKGKTPDLEITGITDEDLAGFGVGSELESEEAKSAREQEENAKLQEHAADLVKKWNVQPGHIYEAGAHKIMCGDSRRADELSRLIGQDKIRFIYSDPPYGISIVNKVGQVTTGLPPGPALGGDKPMTAGKVGGDKPMTAGKVGGIHRGMKAKPIIKSNIYPEIIGDDNGETARAIFGILWRRFPKAVQVWWGANHYSDVFPASSCWLVWDKDNGQSFFADAELAWCSDKTAVRIFKHKWNGLIKDSERGEKRVHPTQKPIALAAWCLDNYSDKGDFVLDPFSGSASCLMACEQTGRVCRAVDLSPAYVAIALERYQKATGQKPKRI